MFINGVINSKADNLEISYKKFSNDHAKASIVIIHGMCEYSDRYNDFAFFLRNEGFNVYTFDVRGHGRTAKSIDDLGYFGPNSVNNLVLDLASVCEFVKEENPNLKLYLFAHSMGTITTRVFLQEYDILVDKVILSGLPHYSREIPFGIFLCKFLAFFYGNKHKSKLLDNLTFSSFYKKIKKRRTNNDWLSFNRENVEKYENDVYTNFHFTVNGYKTLFSLLRKMNKAKLYKLNQKDLPIYILVGDSDPVVGGVKGLNRSFSFLNKVGYVDVNKHIFSNMRHEILNEDEKDLVYKEVLHFFNK